MGDEIADALAQAYPTNPLDAGDALTRDSPGRARGRVEAQIQH
jgi:hypothetical protein